MMTFETRKRILRKHFGAVLVVLVLATGAVSVSSAGGAGSRNSNNNNNVPSTGNFSTSPSQPKTSMIMGEKVINTSKEVGKDFEDGDNELPRVLERNGKKDYEDIKSKVLGWSEKHFWVIILVAVLLVLCISALCCCLLLKK